MPALTPLRPGDPERIAGYRLTGLLGEGGQGAVYLAEGAGGEPVAVKLLHLRKVGDTQARTRFAREVSAARRVGEFCTARVLAADVDGDIPYLVSEYIDGPTLHDAVLRGGLLGGADLHRLAIGMATALAAIHRAGIVHRDFKPGNVLLSARGPKVVDFGIARALDTASTLTSQAIGTPAYMAPEQLGTGAVGPAADVFAWACTLVFAATGQPPFGNDSVPAVVKRITRNEPRLGGLTGPLAQTAMACLAKDPAVRPTAERLLTGLLGQTAPEDPEATLIAGSQAAAALRFTVPPTRPAVRPRRPTRRNLLIGGGVLAAAAVTGGTVAYARTGKPGDRLTLWHRTIAGATIFHTAVAAGTLFLQDIKALRLIALDASTGNQRWAWKLQTSFLTSAGTTLYASGVDNLYAIDAATGRRKWLLETAPLSFTVAGDLLVAGDYASAGTTVFAVDAASGRKRWSHTFHQPDIDLRPNPDKLSASSVVTVLPDRNTVWALSTATGHQLWRFPTEGDSLCGPLAFGDVVYVGNGDGGSGTFWALDAATGRIRWKTSIRLSPQRVLAADRDAVFLVDDGSDVLHALDARSGGERWRYPAAWGVHGPAGGLVFTDRNDGGIDAVDAMTGRVRWQRPKQARDQKDLVYVTASDQAVFLKGQEDELYALRAH